MTVLDAVPAVKVTVPVLAGPVLAATWMVATRPVGPVVGVTVIQDVSDDAASQVGWFVVTVTPILPPPYGAVYVAIEVVNVGAPAWVTVINVDAAPPRTVM